MRLAAAVNLCIFLRRKCNMWRRQCSVRGEVDRRHSAKYNFLCSCPLTVSNYNAYNKIAVVWDVTSCSLVDRYRRFRITRCFHRQGRQKDFCPGEGSISLVSVQQATRRRVPEGCSLNIRCPGNLKYATACH